MRVNGFFGNLRQNRIHLRCHSERAASPIAARFRVPPIRLAGTWLGAAQALYQKCRQATLAGIPFLADLLLDQQSGVSGRTGALALLGCRFGRWLEQLTGDVVDHAFVANMATAYCVTISAHSTSPQWKPFF